MATENLAPQIISRVMGEIRQLVRSKADGIEYVADSKDSESVSEVHAIITGPEGTPFDGGKFRMKLVLGEDYPTSPPRGYFLTKIYHPNVSATGDICVNTLKKDWVPETTLQHVLQVIRCLLIVPFPESSLNDEAGKLFMDSYDEFARRARIMKEVHAMDDTDRKISSSSSSSSSSGSSSSSSSSGLSSSKDGASSPSKQKTSKKEKIKKKSLKRL